jgi:Ca2+-binding EF-hand superfamily protein
METDAFRGYDLNGDGQISKAELRRMYKAYFHLSMELVRDVVKTMEDGLLENFDDQDAKPTSSAFSAPIVSSGPPRDSSPDTQDDNSEMILGKLDTLSSGQAETTPGSPTLLHGQVLFHEDFPVMEAMSQQALEEMVEQTFADAGAQEGDEIDFPRFCIAAEKDPNLLAWFEALGCVF